MATSADSDRQRESTLLAQTAFAMNKLWFALALLAYSVPLVGQPRVDLFIDAEGVRRTGANTDFTPGVTRFEPQFNTGGGVGGGVNWFISDRVSLETKIAGLGSK